MHWARVCLFRKYVRQDAKSLRRPRSNGNSSGVVVMVVGPLVCARACVFVDYNDDDNGAFRACMSIWTPSQRRMRCLLTLSIKSNEYVRLPCGRLSASRCAAALPH